MNDEQEIIELGVVGIKNMGSYSSEVSYEKLNVVTYQGSSYCAKKDTVGNLPTNTEYWQLYAQKGDTGLTGPTGPTGLTGPAGPKGDPSGAPLAVSSTSEMSDTTKVYVNKTDGKWYYYDGDSWEIGGTYQSTEVADNAIDIYKLDDLLAINFDKSYANINFGNATTGHYKYINDGVITDVENASYNYYDVSLDNNTIYNFGGFNNFSVPAIIVYDSSDNSVVYTTPIANSLTRFENVSLVFKTNKSGLKAYINKALYNVHTVPYCYVYNTFLTKINKVDTEKSITKLTEIDGYLCDLRSESEVTIDTIRMSPYADGHTNVYKLSKGVKYIVKSSNVYNYCGLVILNEKMQLSYKSSSENVGGTPVPFTYEFTATNDGYVYLLDWTYNSIHIKSSIIAKNGNKYKNLKWSLIGDSLTDPNVNDSVKKYYSYIQDDLGIQLQNLGQSGCGYMRKFQGGNNFVEQSLLLDDDVDVVTIFGSFNDQHYFDNMGTTSDVTTSTLLGSVYVALTNIITNNPNAKIGVILPTPWASTGLNPNNLSDNANTYIEGIRTIAHKLSIPVLDLFYESNMYAWRSAFRSLYYVNSDGVHPNSDGNKRFAYEIEAFIKKLI